MDPDRTMVAAPMTQAAPASAWATVVAGDRTLDRVSDADLQRTAAPASAWVTVATVGVATAVVMVPAQVMVLAQVMVPARVQAMIPVPI